MHIILLHFYSDQPTPVYARIAAELRARGHTVWVGTPNVDGDLEIVDGQLVVARLPGRGLAADRLGGIPPTIVSLLAPVLRRVSSLGFMWRVRRFLRQSRPDVVQVNPGISFWELLPLFMPGSIHFVLDIRQVNQSGGIDLSSRIKDWWVRWRRQMAARCLYERTCFLHPAGAKVTLGENWPKWGTVVPMGVDPQFLSLDPVYRAQGDDDSVIRFVYVGRFSRVRRLEQVLGAAQQMLAVTDRFRVTLVGHDMTQGFYRALAEEWGLESVVAFHPPVPYAEVPQTVLDHDVALAYVPSRPADWCYHPTLKVLEYRALGVPIIATDNVPNREVVEDGVNGLLVQDSAESLAQAMLRFVLDRDFTRRCRAQAELMRAGTDWCQVAQMYEQDVYEPLLA